VILASLIDTGALWRVILYSLVAGVGMTAVFSFGIVGLTRFDEARHGRRSGSGIGYAVLAALCSLIVLGVVVEAIVIMTRK
jgi:cation transporter-like permease